MAKVITLTEKVELNGLRAELALARFAASKAPPLSRLLIGNAIALSWLRKNDESSSLIALLKSRGRLAFETEARRATAQADKAATC
jgi:hypothetical protein